MVLHRPIETTRLTGHLTQMWGGDILCDMVNSELRLKAASVIRSYLAGKIDNLEFADGFPHDKNDPALRAIGRR